MRHGVAGLKLGRTTAQRNGLRKTMISQLITHERIETTEAKAKFIRSEVEKLVTTAKRGLKAGEAEGKEGKLNVANARQIAAAKVTGSDNIYIGNDVANASGNTESNTIRIGGTGQDKVFVRGVQGVTTGQSNAVAVVVDGNGQLGTINSSRRYKDDIQDMGDVSSGLMKLRPVTYRYTKPYADGSRPIDYGLIAEEVEQVYPDLVVHLENGDVQTVQYQKVNAMLLNEVQKQHRQLGEQQAVMEAQQRELADLKVRLAAIERLLVTDRK